MSDDRGLAFGLLIFGAVLVVGAIMVLVLNPIMTDLFPQIQGQCQTAACTAGEGWVSDAWDYFPWFVLVLGMMMFIRAATVESRRLP